ncbi:AAA family ATPase [Thermosulfuriphilus ammonigenes]|uniref:AAA family ATPase n=1 Tax=Thermosulfuriphilus ammonigenes TaxID=1936021 RepID=A0A6G7PVQ7_9BACT|nr:AAA family ATPase [Thermosulfuriphilus ammonigenes]MBA2848314.1 CO dehydrogenase maturation factor [Thermosulfuriphilus ammonigenes]QIJ71528.1 AAA family ATPase [Thermosulfuriphilus ammonigenes]
MAETIALAGKGGTGKTTVAALVIRYLLEKNLKPILAVDADANANLNELLGLEVEITLGEIKDEMKTSVPTGMTKDQFMELKVHEALIEAPGFDLLVMGQPEGPGCYCAANAFLAQVMEGVAKNYRYLVVDNEAGMEHLSRLNMRRVDYLLVVSDPSSRGVLTAGRIARLTEPLGLEVGRKVLIVNRAPEEIPPALADQIEKTALETGLEFAGYLPHSEELFRFEVERRPLLELPQDSAVLREAYKIFDSLLAQ